MSALETLSHSWSGDGLRIVWEVTYAFDMQHRKETGYGDSDFSHYTRERTVTHLIAPDLEWAKRLFDRKFPASCKYEAVSFDPLCTIDHEVTFK